MEAAEILERARAGEDAPADWLILPLLKRKVQVAMLGWAFGMLIGFGLFAIIASVTIPNNFKMGAVAIIFTLLILGFVLFIGVGSTCALLTDIYRLRHAENYLIVITSDEFVQQEGSKIVHVPLVNVRYITARGTPPPERPTPGKSAMSEIPRAGEYVAGSIFGRGFMPQGFRQRRKRMRTPTTLAFLDTRGDVEVIVATDSSYGDPFLIAAHLKQYASSVQQLA
jgi:hypothetical protein